MAEDDLEKLAPRIGSPIQLEFYEPNMRASVKLIGFMPGKSIITSVPQKDGVPMLIKEGRMAQVRFMGRQDVVGFSSTVIKSFTSPYPHLHFEYPRQLAHVQVRKAPRVETEVIASVTVAKGSAHEKDMPAKILDLSRTGTRMMGKAGMARKADAVEMAFKIKIGDHNHILRIPAVVRAITDGPNPDTRYYGMEFTALEARESTLIDAFVNQCLLVTS